MKSPAPKPRRGKRKPERLGAKLEVRDVLKRKPKVGEVIRVPPEKEYDCKAVKVDRNWVYYVLPEIRNSKGKMRHAYWNSFRRVNRRRP